MQTLTQTSKNESIHARQIAFFSAFILPIYKMTELPSLLARYAKGDLLIPALLHYALQTGLLLLLLLVVSSSEKPLIERIEDKLGKWSVVVYAVYALYFLLSAVLPLLDLEKFVYAVFYDTSPTLFSFVFFFIVSGFICTKGIKAVGRFSDLAFFLFLFPFLLLMVMSLVEADFSNLLPVFEQPFKKSAKAFSSTIPHFSDVAFILPLLANLRYKKGDGKKIVGGYAVGGFFTLVFLGVFYAVYSTIAPREHYAFAKIAQYFPALTLVGRIDLLLVYALSVLLIFFTSLPLHYATLCIAKPLKTNRKTLLSVLITFGAFVFVLFFNRRYNSIYAFFTENLFAVFLILADLLPLFLLFFLKNNPKERPHA